MSIFFLKNQHITNKILIKHLEYLGICHFDFKKTIKWDKKNFFLLPPKTKDIFFKFLFQIYLKIKFLFKFIYFNKIYQFYLKHCGEIAKVN